MNKMEIPQVETAPEAPGASPHIEKELIEKELNKIREMAQQLGDSILDLEEEIKIKLPRVIKDARDLLRMDSIKLDDVRNVRRKVLYICDDFTDIYVLAKDIMEKMARLIDKMYQPILDG